MSLSVRFNTRPFVTSHGREPRGRGSWAFAFGVSTGGVEFSPSMTFAEAKRWATARARQHAADLNVPASNVVFNPLWVDVLP